MFKFRLTVAAFAAFGACIMLANPAGAGLFDGLWTMPQRTVSPAPASGILPGGCYVPAPPTKRVGMSPGDCPSGWCGTGYGSLPGSWPGGVCPTLTESYRAGTWPSATPGYPAFPAARYRSYEPAAAGRRARIGMLDGSIERDLFDSSRTPFFGDVEVEFDRYHRLIGRNPAVRDFHILPVHSGPMGRSGPITPLYP